MTHGERIGCATYYVLAFVILFCWAAPVRSQTSAADTKSENARLALVLGNSDYIHAPKLLNPGHDAKLIAGPLRAAGFEVTVAINSSAIDMKRALREFYGKIARAPNPITLLYFSGHGIEFQGKNYLIPTDASLAKETDIETETISLDGLTEGLTAASLDSLNFIVVDAARNNPFVRSLSRGFGPRGLSGIDAGDRIVYLFSASPGAVALDGAGNNSPFAEALARAITTPGMEWTDVYRTVQRDVLRTTNGQQKPSMYGLPPKAFYFLPTSGQPNDDPLGGDRVALGRVPLLGTKGAITYGYEESHALIIGVSRYKNNNAWSDLPGVRDDVVAVKAALQDAHGFVVTTVLDPDRTGLENAIGEFIKVNGRKENARLLIYFAGHGATTTIRGRKIGWIVPSDAPHPIDAPAEFAAKAVSMRRIEEYSEYIEAKHVLWIFDSCFSGAIFDMVSRAGPVRTDWEEHLLSRPIRRIITSGSDGEEVPDKSVFRELFVEALNGTRDISRGKSVFSANELGQFLKENVIKYRRQKQTPQNGTVVIRGLDEGDMLFKLSGGATKSSTR